VPFGNSQIPTITIKESTNKPLKCKDFDLKYVSVQQCLVDYFNSNDFPLCEKKCVPIQMKGFRYVKNSSNILDCTSLEDEICNGGPNVWLDLVYITELECLMPCNMTGIVSTNKVTSVLASI
jgi:hypothetical protein